MNNRIRAALAALSAAALCWLVLWLLHGMLDAPAVRRFDVTVQALVHSWEQPWLTRVMTALTYIGAIKIFSVSLATVLAGMLWRGRRHGAVLLAFAISGAFVLNEALKLGFHRPRPVVPWSIGDEHTFSFPSGHSLFSVTLYGTLSWLALRHGASIRRRLGVLIPAVLLPFSIGLSRIYLGEHWPTDVIAGWTCGLIWLGGVAWADTLWNGSADLAGEVKKRLSTESQAAAQPLAERT